MDWGKSLVNGDEALEFCAMLAGVATTTPDVAARQALEQARDRIAYYAGLVLGLQSRLADLERPKPDTFKVS